MARWLWMVSALIALGLSACGPSETDASDRHFAPGEPHVEIRPAKPRRGSNAIAPTITTSKPTSKPKPEPKPEPTSGGGTDTRATGPIGSSPTKPAAPTEPGVEVFFKDGLAGFLTADELERELATYRFETAGTFGSVGLGRAILDTGRAEVTINWHGNRRNLYAVKLTENTIDLTPHADLSRTAMARSYMPLMTGATFEYQGRGGLDNTTYVLRTQRIGFVNWHYLVEIPQDGNAERLAQHFLCRGAFQKGAGGVIFIEAANIADLDRQSPGPRQVLLGLPPTVGWTVRHTYEETTKSFKLTVEAFEPVVVPAGTFDRCARIRSEPAQGMVPGRTYWLAPGVGLVKVTVDDGGVLELANHDLP